MVKKNFLNISLSIILIGLLLRIYNLNTEGYWWDEMLGFWTANPNISYSETYNRHIRNDHTSIAYHLLIKLYYSIFGYIPEIGRYFTMLLGVICIPLMGVLIKSINIKNTSVIYCTMFLTGFNVFLIEYSQENRVYILIFLISLINLIYFFRITLKEKRIRYNFIFYFTSSITGLILTPFFTVIIGAQIFYAALQILIYRSNYFAILSLSILSVIVYISLFFGNLTSIISSSSMADKGVGYSEFVPNIRYLYDLFFPKFFGSKIMGLIFLITFVFAIFSNLKNIFQKNSVYLYFLILIIFSYLTPILITYFFYSNFSARYIIFILIPIITMISIFVGRKKISFKKNYFLILIISSTIINSIFEISNKNLLKPGFNDIIETINNSQVKNFYIYSNYKTLVDRKAKVENKLDKNTIEIVSNYMSANKNVLKYKLDLVDDNSIGNQKKIWIICYQPSGFYRCKMEKLERLKFKILDKKVSRSITANLIEY